MALRAAFGSVPVSDVLNTLDHTSQVESPRGVAETVSDFPNIVGRSIAMRGLLRVVKLVANSNATVLIQGESGTGKELIAGAIHRHSARHDQPFVAIDCGALPESLLGSELFGHVKGAFTGAVAHNEGLFKHAHGGTLLLDEIGNTTLAFQAKLLRVLQEGEIKPVGSNRSEKVDVRVIASTNTELMKAVEERSFRQDLYYRLAVVPLVLPPLRERREDIPLLVEHFIDKYCQQNRLQPKRASAEGLTLITAYAWPGNVRELENVIERAILLSPGVEITPENLFVPPVARKSPATLQQATKEATAAVERKKIEEAMHIAQRNRSHAARLLGISRATLYNKLNRYGLGCCIMALSSHLSKALDIVSVGGIR